MKRLALSVALASLVAVDTAAAQGSASPLQSGSRLRIFVVDTVRSTGGLHFTYPAGTLVRLDQGSLLLLPDSIVGSGVAAADTLRVPLTNIGSIETFTGEKRHALLGGAAGLVVGGVVGWIFGNPSYGGGVQCYYVAGSQFCGTSRRHSDTQMIHAATFGGIGALAGAAVGHFIRTERWAQIDVASLRLQPGIR